MEAIEIEGVGKSFGGHRAVDDLSLVVPRGSVYGFIGPNGSGKTTTIRMIMRILLPDAGRISVLGQEDDRVVRDRVGYLPEERGLYKKMTVRRQLRYFGRLKGVTDDVDRRIDGWLERLRLTEWADKKVDALSKGMSQRVQFIATVLPEPELMILDEPFSGLDPVNLEDLRDVMLEARDAGSTVVLSTHDMGVAERMCDRIFMIHEGRKVLDGSLDEIQAAHGHDVVRVRTEGGRGVLDGLAGITHVRDEGRHQDVTLDVDPQEFLVALASRTAIRSFEVTRPSLHEIFVRIARPEAEAVAS